MFISDSLAIESQAAREDQFSELNHCSFFFGARIEFSARISFFVTRI